VTTAQDHIADTLNRAQGCFELTVDPTGTPTGRRVAVNLFIHHVTSAVLLEHLRRLDQTLADQLVPWMLAEGGIFEDGYAGEMLHEWRQQLAAGQPMYPIGPQTTDQVSA
jgi:hypothetical protein